MVGIKKQTKPGKQARNLVIVESPTKAKTLRKFLGEGYTIDASVGHVRDLPKSSLGVDVERGFEPLYETVQGKDKIISRLKREVQGAETVYLATDLDREGEAIAWQLQEALGLEDPYRVVFHEITKSAIKEAFQVPRKLNLDLVAAQKARRVLDRLVGYKLSPLLWKKVRYGLSAGRVQSIAVRFVVEREKERESFESAKYWTIQALLQKGKGKFSADLVSHSGEKYLVSTKLNLFAGGYTFRSSTLTSEEDCNRVGNELARQDFVVSEVERKEVRRRPSPPFTTASLQRAAATKLRFSPRKVMQVAQRLYENGFITYHRTDSMSLSSSFVSAAREHIQDSWGERYLPQKPVVYKSRAKSAQEAHEAIRPSNLAAAPSGLGADQQKLYSLILKRAVASQMVPAVIDRMVVTITAGEYLLTALGSQLKFGGWLSIYGGADQSVDKVLPELAVGDSLDLIEVQSGKHLTQSPPRYTEASLIKTLEDYGIGRPSTYATIIFTIQSRGYVSRDGLQLVPTDTGVVVTTLLTNHFRNIVDINFTADLEADLDEIAQGKQEWAEVISDFYGPFEKALQQKDQELEKKDITTLGEVDRACPECEKPLIVKLGRYGKFVSCSGFPECKYGESIDREDAEPVDASQLGACPECDGELKVKTGRFGKFVACSHYPECKYTKPYLEKIGVKCPGCGVGEVVVKRGKGKQVFYGCSEYPECKYNSRKKPG